MNDLQPKARARLVSAALAARDAAYAPFSGFLVGSAVLDEHGAVHGGANVENSSYGLTICAERAAACAAVASGARALQAVAVVSDGAHAPCGACRQFLYELGGPDLAVLLVDRESGALRETIPLGELLPRGFRLTPAGE